MTANKQSPQASTPVKTNDYSNSPYAQGLDITNLSEDDIKSLHSEDPFMFYSIPGIHKAAMLGRQVDFSDRDALLSREQQDLGQDGNETRSTFVPRRLMSLTQL